MYQLVCACTYQLVCGCRSAVCAVLEEADVSFVVRCCHFLCSFSRCECMRAYVHVCVCACVFVQTQYIEKARQHMLAMKRKRVSLSLCVCVSVCLSFCLYLYKRVWLQMCTSQLKWLQNPSLMRTVPIVLQLYNTYVQCTLTAMLHLLIYIYGHLSCSSYYSSQC